jgi:H+/Cl- antiporter ClcA
LNAAWPGAGVVSFGLVGAAAVLAAAQRAPFTAIVLLFDFTHCSPTIAAPAVVAVAGAVATRRVINRRHG